MSRLYEIRLPNGLDVKCVCPTTAKMVYREILEDPSYLRHGIVLKDGDRVFDVGANEGYFLLLLNQAAQDLEVFSFEPIPRTFEALQHNSQKHCKHRVRLMNVGLSSQAGEATFRFFPRSTSLSTMRPGTVGITPSENRELIFEEMRHHPNRALRWSLATLPGWVRTGIAEAIRRFYDRTEQVVCSLRTLSEMIDEHHVDRIDLLKIDTEGAEHQILDGIRPEHWPLIRQLVVEVHDGAKGLERVLARLGEQGFTTVVEKHANYSQISLVFAQRS